MGLPSKAATRRPRPERDGAAISTSGGQGRAVLWVSTFQTGGWTSKVDMISTTPTLFSQRAGPRRCGRKLPRNAASPPSLSLLAPSRPPSWEREKGAAGVMGGQGGVSPGRGFEGAGAPRQPQCITLGRLAPRHCAVRRRPRCPRLARRSGAPQESGAGGGTCGP